MHLSVKHFKKAQILYSSAKPGFVFMTETYFEHHPACIASSTLPTFGSCCLQGCHQIQNTNQLLD